MSINDIFVKSVTELIRIEGGGKPANLFRMASRCSRGSSDDAAKGILNRFRGQGKAPVFHKDRALLCTKKL
jgi:hypothetical protein